MIYNLKQSTVVKEEESEEKCDLTFQSNVLEAESDDSAFDPSDLYHLDTKSFFLYPNTDYVQFFSFLQRNKIGPTLKKNWLKAMTSLLIL